MSDVEHLRTQYEQSLQDVADSMKHCAAMAENFAKALKGSTFSVHSPAMNGVDENGKRKRNVKPKDPNAPKRPPSTYILFQNDIRPQIKAKNPEMTPAEIRVEISQQWNALTDEEKDKYNKAVAVDKQRYKDEMANYDPKDSAVQTKEPKKKTQETKKEIIPSKKLVPKAKTPVESGSEVSDDDEDASASEEDLARPSKKTVTTSESEDESDVEDSPPPPPAKKSKTSRK